MFLRFEFFGGGVSYFHSWCTIQVEFVLREGDCRYIERDEIDIRYLKIAGAADGAGEISNQDQLGVIPEKKTKAPVLRRKAIGLSALI